MNDETQSQEVVEEETPVKRLAFAAFGAREFWVDETHEKFKDTVFEKAGAFRVKILAFTHHEVSRINKDCIEYSKKGVDIDAEQLTAKQFFKCCTGWEIKGEENEKIIDLEFNTANKKNILSEQYEFAEIIVEIAKSTRLAKEKQEEQSLGN